MGEPRLDLEAAVAEQYVSYPFPPRDPAEEERRLITTTLGDLERASDLLWGGRRRLDTLRVLDAGCGTGDSAIYMAAQAPRAQVVALDASAASLAVTRQRAQARGLANVETVNASLLDLPGLGLGPFDYVVCSGVLHHLPDPPAGLRVLVDVLHPYGGLGLMLYARHGRVPVYQVQELLRRLSGGAPLAERVTLAAEVLAVLPDRHLFKVARLEQQVLDLSVYGDAGLVDLLLHACDRAYTVEEVHAFLGAASLELLDFHRPVLYRPESYPLTDALRERAAVLPEAERQAVAELLNGRMIKHELYAAPAGDGRRAPGPQEPPSRVRPRLYEPGVAAWFRRLQPVAQPFRLESTEGFTITLELSAADCALLAGVDGERSLASVLGHAADVLRAASIATSTDDLETAWARLAGELHAAGYLGYAWA
jgi:2-polyprenyl-3-methyl-5-hydroxy-6-metoxy-1,4-benzoquinol methylase